MVLVAEAQQLKAKLMLKTNSSARSGRWLPRMPSMSKMLVAGLASQAGALMLPTAAMPYPAAAMPRAGALLMADSEATRDSSPAATPQSFDNNMDGWKPPSGGGGAHTLGGEYSATDTPDFLPEEGSELAAKAAGISFTDGIKGSQTQNDPNKKKSTGPELAGALESDPDIYVPEILEVQKDDSQFVLPEPKWNVNAMAITNIDAELDFFTAATESAKLVVDVKPVCMTFEDYYCGFTADSHPSFSVSPDKGTMERRNGPPTELTVTCEPKGQSGELVAHLCVILPDEKDFSTYYKITCNSR